jgi:hypothetical protein
MQRFDLKNDAELEEHYKAEIWNRFVALEESDAYVDTIYLE